MVADCNVRDLALADQGVRRIAWAAGEMAVLAGIGERFARERPLAGIRVAACLHVTAETANLVRVLVAGGAQVRLCASNPLSTQDDVAAALVARDAVPVFAVRGESTEAYYRNIDAALSGGPQLTLDDGADLISRLHGPRAAWLPGVIGGMEETTTGVMRLRAMAAEGALRYPVIAVNDAMSKHFFDNRYGTGQSTLDGILRATNILLAGKVFTVAGYGWCGRGIALRARGMGAQVIVTEVDSLRALEALMDGYRVMPMAEAARVSDFIVTATGDKNVVDASHFELMKDGCVLANAGHFNVEVDIAALAHLAVSSHRPREHVEEYRLGDGRRLRLLAEGRLVNLAAAEGHPSSVMDMSFANQALCAEHFMKNRGRLEARVHEVPPEIDREVARLKLAAMGIAIDTLSEAQRAYLVSWKEGT
ncbi:MAG: adenosylhomocysteinase [Betaproteobacteria bacterium]|nr:MAG: adenosylhomocysteinase [Betaproteobacteria bacterium]